MIDTSLAALQNGSDIRGVATDGIIGENVTLTADKVAKIGVGFVTWLFDSFTPTQEKPRPRIAIGMDARLTGPAFAEALQKCISEAGADALSCGLATTPAMRFCTLHSELDIDGAIMLTGSHLAFNQNGMKFFANGSELDKEQLSQILEIASSDKKNPPVPHGEVHIFNLLSFYSNTLREKIRNDLSDIADDPAKPLIGLKIVVDAGNSSGGFFAKRVLEPLGADTSGSQFLTPDGRFPNHSPNPEDFEAMRSISTAVLLAGADMGVIFDADVDRVAIVDDKGRAINRNEFVAMAAAITLEEHPGTSIVTDSITSNGLTRFVQDILGGHHCRFQRGYRNVIGEAIRKDNAGMPTWLAVETSGHAAFKENNFCDDGAYFATKVIIRLTKLKHEGKELFSLIERLPVPTESKEFRLTIVNDDFTRTAARILDGLRQYVAQIDWWEEVNQNHDGLRVICNGANEQGWFLFRLSLHSPVMPLNVESDVKGGARSIIDKLKMFFRNVKSIDSSILYN
ncbi:MAG: phosphomannomutase/phosphoglucomutase [Bacteroidales bacterium]|nr:phosphomannomutase/phosphoglucomutase [Bacteroidales bacterium]